MNENPLEKHILATYLSLRYGLAAIAFSFPVLLWIGGHLYAHVGLQNSMSAYYYACTDGRSIRTWFCGTLFAVAACLYLYKGYRRAENIALNMAGLLALGIAEFPKDWTAKTSGILDEEKVLACLGGIAPVVGGTSLHAYLHGFCAISFYVCIAFVCLFCASNTLPLMNNPAKESRYRRYYHWIGAAILASPLAAFLLTQLLERYDILTFLAEALGIYAFSVYWLVKSHEIRQTNADLEAIEGRLERQIRTRAVLDDVRIVRRSRPRQ